ncbi:class I SAM-dependent methyltransferase [Macrococcus equipercicus]|uniref:Class I SAM-dependent methyltransferase n=1 Tax=Macrococcus equipercicus TaxID=69967 RepID=A0A9Q9BU05_9STAP|nr:class I SAM-dependent methyltransferase [Macrococcus equipercicus]UTH12833.1 class I SAM-dependent methyltransferase [Macrococcus equipercicus]
MSIVSKVRITSPVKTDDVIFLMMKQTQAELALLVPDMAIERVTRRKQTITELFKTDDSPVIVISRQLPVLYFSADEKIVYHENTMNFKLKRFHKYGEVPPLIAVMPVELTSRAVIVDATMGLGNDLMLMAHMLKSARFHAFEAHPLIYYVIKEGIIRYYSEELTGRITFHYGTACDDIVAASDVVYADPMFETTISQDSGMQVLTNHVQQADHDFLAALIVHAPCVILKAHFRSPLFQQYGFQVAVRKSSKSHFGIICN